MAHAEALEIVWPAARRQLGYSLMLFAAIAKAHRTLIAAGPPMQPHCATVIGELPFSGGVMMKPCLPDADTDVGPVRNC